MPNQTFDVQGALNAGASEDDVLQHLTATRPFDVDGALKAGASKRDIIDHLSSLPPKSSKIQPTQYAEPTPPQPGFLGGTDAISRAISGVGDALGFNSHGNENLAHAKAAVDDFKSGHYGSALGHGLAAAVPLTGPVVYNAVTGAIDQGKKAADSFQHGNYSQALGHGVAAALPVIGPGVADAADLAGGQAPKFDQYGGMTDPGQEPDIARAMGQLAPLAADPILKAATPIAKGLTKPLRTTGLTPIEAEAISHVQSEGVPISAATKSGNTFVKHAQMLADSSPLGSVVASNAQKATDAGLTNYSERLMDMAHPQSTVPEAAGTETAEAIAAKAKNEGDLLHAAYGKFQSAAADPRNVKSVIRGYKTVQSPQASLLGPDEKPLPAPPPQTVPIVDQVALPVDISQVKQNIKPIFEDMSEWMAPASTYSSDGFQAMKSLLSKPDVIPATQAEAGLGGLKQLAREGSGRNAGAAKLIISQLQPLIDDAVSQGGPDAIRGLQEGRAATATQAETKEVLKQLRKEPVEAFNQLTRQKDGGIGFLRQIADQAPTELPKVGRAYLENLFNQATATGGFTGADGLYSQWRKLGTETKNLLFSDPALVDRLDKFFLAAKKIAENPNPSGSGKAVGVLGTGQLIFTNPKLGIPLVIGTGAVSKLLHSQTGIGLLSKGMTIPAGSAQAAALSTQILRLAGKDVTPVAPTNAAQNQSTEDEQKQQVSAQSASRQMPQYDPLGILKQ